MINLTDKFISTDSVYQVPTRTPLLLLDCRVLLFQLLERVSHIKKENIQHLWQYIIHSAPQRIHSNMSKARVVLLDDWRSEQIENDYNYWRESWLRENRPDCPIYKGNRGDAKVRPEGYNELHESVLEYCDKVNISVFRQEGFEADDFAGAFARVKLSLDKRTYGYKRECFTYTVDNDHCQLVNDKSNFLFFQCGTYKVPISKIRREYDVLRYYQEREGVWMESPREVVDLKALKGDLGDNIYPNSPREIIDLIGPPVMPSVELHDKIEKELQNKAPNISKKAAYRSLQIITKDSFGVM